MHAIVCDGLIKDYKTQKLVRALDGVSFEIEKGEITPTLKVKRKIVEQKYKDIIDALYKE